MLLFVCLFVCLFVYPGNTNLVYSIIRSKSVFHQLVNLSSTSQPIRKPPPLEPPLDNGTAKGEATTAEPSASAGSNAGTVCGDPMMSS